MKPAYFILSGFLMMTSLNIFDCKSYQTKDKRSVFDIISNIDKDNNTNEEPTKIRSHISVIGKAVKEGNAIEYQELKNIFLGQGTIQKKVHQSRKRNLKKQFLKESKQGHESMLINRKQNNLFVNFYFLTKLS
jgi:hypothetical protein